MPAADLRLVELLTAHLCHELSGPVGAIGNGVELLSDDDADFVKDAVALIGGSAARVAARLQFYRFAYGFGRAGSRTGPAPHELAAALFAGSRIACDYREEGEPPPLDWHKLGCNLLLAAAEGLPRGGHLVLSAGAGGPTVEAYGERAALPPQTRAGLRLETAPEELTTRSVHAYFTGLLAAELGWRIDFDNAPGRFRLLTAPE